jgi:hypothetical protein
MKQQKLIDVYCRMGAIHKALRQPSIVEKGSLEVR